MLYISTKEDYGDKEYMRDVQRLPLHMNLRLQSTVSRFVPFLLLAFLVCGVGGMFCPMPAAATDTHHSQQTSHHSSSSQATGDCPEQLTSSTGSFENNNGPLEVLSGAAFTWLHDILNSSASQFFGNHTTSQSSTTPLLFLLFSVFLN